MSPCSAALAVLLLCPLASGAAEQPAARSAARPAAEDDAAKLFSTAAAPPLALTLGKPLKQDGATLTDVSYAGATPGARLEGTLVEPTTPGPHPAVLFVHWLGDPQTTNRTEFQEEALGLARRGVVSLLVDAQWSQRGWWRNRVLAEDRSRSIRQVIELRRALDVLASRKDVDLKHLAYVGHDFGAMYGVLAGAADQRPTTYVLMAGTPHFSTWFLDLVPKEQQPQGAQRATYVEQLAAVDPVRFVGRLGHASVFFQFADNDRFVTAAAAQEFAAAAREPKLIRNYPVSHNMDSKVGTSDRFRWLAKELGLDK